MSADVKPSGGPRIPEHEQLQRLGKYAIQKRLGAGGMGTVFLALDEELRRTVALKVLAKDRAENPILVKRFKAEGQAAAYLQHRNIVSVYEAGQIDGFLYIALEYIDGTDVLDIIRKRGVMPVKRTISIIRQVAEALDHAYEKQIVHRDIKPSNLLLKADGSVKLADLGLARSIDDTLDTSITRAGTTVGTVDYMSPEQARNSKAADIRSDIYSLGCTWYHMLTGVPPYGEGSMTNKLQAHAITPPPDPRLRNEQVPEGIVAVLQRMMAKRPQDRYQTPAELIEELKNPALNRTVLNEDVLAALATDLDDESVDVDNQFDDDIDEPEIASSPTAGDVGTSNDGPAARRTAPARETPSQETPEPSRRHFKRLSPEEQKNARRSSSVERETPEEPEDARPAKYNRADRKRAEEVARAKLPPRESVAPEKFASPKPSKKDKKVRTLPPRSDQPILSAPVKATIDPTILKYGVVTVIVVATLGLLGFAFSRMGDAPQTTTTTINPYDTAVGVETPKGTPTVPQDANAGSDPPKEEPAEEVVTVTDAANDPLPPVTEERKSAEPLAGAGDLDLSGTRGRELVGDWAFAIRRSIVKADAPIVVHRGPEGAEGPRSLAEAVKALPPEGSVIEFSGEGPYVISPMDLPERERLTLRGHNGSQPVLVVSTAGLASGESCLRLPGGTLVLENLHLVMTAYEQAAGDLNLISASGVSAKNVTITKTGPSSLPATALHIASTDGAASGCVLENCMIRGDSLSAVRLSGPRSNLLAGNCLLASGTTPTIVVEPAEQATGGSRSITLLGVNLVSRNEGLALRHGLPGRPVPLKIGSRNTVFITDQENSSAWMDVSNWPVTPGDDLEHPLAAGLSWTADQTVFVGWSKLVHFESGAGASLDAADDHGWKQFWRQSATTIEPKPAIAGLPGDIGTLSPTAVAEQLASAGFRSTGSDAATISSPPPGILGRFEAIAGRQRLPADFFADRTPTQTVEFDLSKAAQLNAFLNDATKCPDGALVRLKGLGLRTIPPIKIENKSLHLEFIQTEGAPLVIRPQVSSGSSPESWITVQNGFIDIIGAKLTLPDSERQPNPASLLSVDGGGFAIRQSLLLGPTSKSTTDAPLIRWSGDAAQRGFALIEDSVLVGHAALVSGPLSNRLIEVRNSVLAGSDDVFQASPSKPDAPQGTLAVVQSTLLFGKAGIRILADTPPPAVFLTHCVFAPSMLSGTESSTVLAIDGKTTPEQMTWWGDGNGYATSLKQMLAIGGQPVIPGTDVAAWTSRWGDGHVLRPLADPKGVLMKDAIPAVDKIDATSFALADRCLAADWKAEGGPIGAEIKSIGPRPEIPSSTPESASQSPATARPRQQGNPGF